jgi:hypothetical protein
MSLDLGGLYSAFDASSFGGRFRVVEWSLLSRIGPDDFSAALLIHEHHILEFAYFAGREAISALCFEQTESIGDMPRNMPHAGTRD